MDSYETFKYTILGGAGLVIIAILIGFVFSTKEMMRRFDFFERVARSPAGQVSAWFEQYESEFDFVPYTATVLHIRIKGDAESQSFEYNDIEEAVEALVRAGVQIKNPMPVVEKVKKRLAGESRRKSRA